DRPLVRRPGRPRRDCERLVLTGPDDLDRRRLSQGLLRDRPKLFGALNRLSGQRLHDVATPKTSAGRGRSGQYLRDADLGLRHLGPARGEGPREEHDRGDDVHRRSGRQDRDPPPATRRGKAARRAGILFPEHSHVSAERNEIERVPGFTTTKRNEPGWKPDSELLDLNP